MSAPESESGFRPGRWLLDRGWWALPLLLSVALAIPWVCGERWYSDASYYQAISTQMARETTWWSPMQGDLPYFNKPPLAFWMHGALVKVFGDADWAAHLPEGVAFVAVCLLTGWLARRFHGALVGVLAGCAMALTNDWIVRVSNFKLDLLHTMWLLGALACWVPVLFPAREAAAQTPQARGREWAWMLGAGACIGAALMTKPLYAAGAGLIALLWLWLAGQWSVRRAVMVAASVGVGVLIAAPWHVSMCMSYGERFLHAYIHQQTVERAMGELHDRQPWYWYLQLIAGTIGEAIEPRKMWVIYGLAIVGMIVASARRRRVGIPVRAGDALAVLWTVLWFVSLSLFGGKRNYYLLVLHPGTAWLAAIAMGWMIARAGDAIGRERVQGVLRVAAIAGLIAGVVLLVRAPSLVAKGHRELSVPERNEFMAFIRSQHAAGRAVYDCGLSYRIASLAYIQAGFWPRVPSERTGYTPAAVPAGGLMAYKSDMLEKGAFGTFVDPRDRLVFRSSPDGQYTVHERYAGAVPIIGPVPVAK